MGVGYAERVEDTMTGHWGWTAVLGLLLLLVCSRPGGASPAPAAPLPHTDESGLRESDGVGTTSTPRTLLVLGSGACAVAAVGYVLLRRS